MPTESPGSKVLTLVFTDLKGSTSLKAEKGDDVAGVLIARHREHVKRVALTDGGRIIDWAGDGCFLIFETPSAAVLFALHLQQTHQKPLFDLIGTPPEHKRHIIYEAGHVPLPRAQMLKDIMMWLDKYQGQVNTKGSSGTPKTTE